MNRQITQRRAYLCMLLMNLLTPPSLASGDSLVWLSKAFMMVKSARIFWVKPVKHDMFHFMVILYQVLQQTGVFFF